MHQTPVASVFISLILTFLSSCASAPIEMRVYQPVGNAPVISFSHGGAWSPQYHYTVNGVQACREVGLPQTDSQTHITSFPIAKQEEVTPTSEQWRAFWQRVEPLRLTDWREAYNSKDIGDQVPCGTQWYLQYTTEAGEHTSSGDNGYPILGKPKTGTLNTASFTELIAAFDLLFPTTTMQFARNE